MWPTLSKRPTGLLVTAGEELGKQVFPATAKVHRTGLDGRGRHQNVLSYTSWGNNDHAFAISASVHSQSAFPAS